MRGGLVLLRTLLLVGALLASGHPVCAASAVPTADPVTARLVPETRAAVPGQTLWVDLHLDIAPGWHTYWRNPGDSGLPTEIAWHLPAGFSAGDTQWPAPERFVQGAIGNYGYAGATDLLVPIAVPAALAPGGTLHLAAEAKWLVCSDICIPGEAALPLDLPVAAVAPAPEPSATALFAAARTLLPKPAPFDVRYAARAEELRLHLPAAMGGGANSSAEFFPYGGNIVDAAAAPRLEQRDNGDDLVLRRIAGPSAAPLPETLSGVLAVRGSDGTEHAYEVGAPRAAPVPLDNGPGIVWWQAVLLAVLGGLVLNLMPCVFPVLSLKLVGLVGDEDLSERRRQGLAYAAGVVLSFALLGAVLLALRAGGAAVGWGFQLQSPLVVALLAYLLFAIGLSLSGVAEFGQGLTDVGGGWASRRGLAGAFATGVLATVVATPCTAPFMGTALGFAVVAPAALGLVVFIALGVGLALPVVLATAMPRLARMLPRPGPWMAWFKQLLAFPLYASVAWLLWVLIQEVGPANAFAALLGIVVVGFAVWIYGRTRMNDAMGRSIGGAVALGAVAVALLLAASLTAAALPTERADARGDRLAYERFSTARLDRLITEHRAVFVNLTAAWCITCLVNEQAALDREAVRQTFAERRVVALKGDWTRQNPEISDFLRQFGRSGVPLYLLYDTAGTPTVLPQILTQASLIEALQKL